MIWPPPEPLGAVFALLLGLILGSFLNVCIYRLPRAESLVRPPSHCPSCGTTIRWYQNVPVVSWIALRGRCAHCSSVISWRYPFVELLCGALLLSLWRGFGPSAAFAVSAVFGLSLVVLFFTDLDHQLLPDAITLTGLGLGLALAPLNPFLSGAAWERLWSAGVGAVLGSGLLWGIGTAYSRLRKVDAMGLGDVKMMGMVGAFAGPLGVLFTLFTASIVGAIVGLALIPLRGRTLQDTLPFGCFLAPAALAALLFGPPAVAAYFSYVRALIGGS